MKLKQLVLKNIGPFTEFVIDFQNESNVLIGPNNGGKSTVLSAIRVAHHCLTDVPAGVAYQDRLRAAKGKSAAHARRGNSIIEVPDYHVEVKAIVSELNLSSIHQLRSVQRGGADSTIQVSLCEGNTDHTFIVHITDDPSSVLVRWDDESVNHENFGEYVSRIQKWSIGISPITGFLAYPENEMSWDHYVKQIKEGKHDRAWRNALRWLFEGAAIERQSEAVSLLADFFPSVKMMPPSRIRSGNNNALQMLYEEHGLGHDVSSSGAGLRSAVSSVVSLVLLECDTFLMDEPEVHLHPKNRSLLARLVLDKSGSEKQVILATHSQEMLEEFNLDNVMWVSSRNATAISARPIQESLCDLGVFSKAAAAEFGESDRFLFVEGDTEKKGIASLLDHGSKTAGDICIAKLSGSGDLKYLKGWARVHKAAGGNLRSVSVIVDSDYGELDHELRIVTEDVLQIISLPCKEIENLFLLEPCVLHSAVLAAISKTQGFDNDDQSHSIKLSDIEGLIDECANDPGIVNTLKSNWLPRYFSKLNKERFDKGDYLSAEGEFNSIISDRLMLRRMVPGKDALSMFRRKVSARFGVSLPGTIALLRHHPPKVLSDVVSQVSKHMGLTTDDASAGI